MADAEIEQIGRDLIDSLSRAMETMGDEIARNIQSSISIGVGFSVGPKGGLYLVRSFPGEPPRLETGELHDSISWEVNTSGERIELVVFTDVLHGLWMEEGTKDEKGNRAIAPRPFMAPAFDRYEETIGDRLASMIADY